MTTAYVQGPEDIVAIVDHDSGRDSFGEGKGILIHTQGKEGSPTGHYARVLEKDNEGNYFEPDDIPVALSGSETAFNMDGIDYILVHV